MTVLNVLLVDDDSANVELMASTLPTEIEGSTIRWDTCDNFDVALEWIADRRFDIVATDIYHGGPPKNTVTGDPQGMRIQDKIRERRFSPILLFTDGSWPPDYHEGPFLKFADKSGGNDMIVNKMES